MKKLTVLIVTLAIGICNIYAQCVDSWTQKADFGGTARFYAVGFSIGDKGYVGTGFDGAETKDFWEYDPASDTWTQKADFGGTARYIAAGFSIGDKGYIGTGSASAGYEKDFWEYDTISNAWTQKADFGGTARRNATAFSIGDKGYIGTGYDVAYRKDFWEYDAASDTWTQIADFGGTAKYAATSFSIGDKGYVGTGWIGSATKDFWEYDVASDAWTQKADFGGTARVYAVGFSIGDKGYIGMGNGYKDDIWAYDTASNAWTQKTNFGGLGKEGPIAFSIGDKGYIGTGYTSTKAFWEYTPELSASTFATNVSCNGGIDGSASVPVLGGAPPYTYLWSNAQTTFAITGLSAGSYLCTVTDFNNCSVYDTAFVAEPTALTVSASKIDTICGETYGLASATVGGGTSPYSYLWSNGDTTAAVDSLITAGYGVTITDNNACNISDTIIITNDLAWQAIPICLITVDSTSSKNEIVWAKPVSLAIDSFRIYREITTNNYQQIGAVEYNQLSFFVDATMGVDPNITSYRYKITVLDTCGNESLLSDFHKTIHMVVVPGIPPAMELSWDDYEGFAVTSYNILRDSTGLFNWEVINTIPFGITSFTDPNPPQTPDLKYIVEVVPPDTCTADKMGKDYNTSRSNTTITSTLLLTTSATSTNATQGNCDGTATANPSGGITPYTYFWNTVPAQTTLTATGLCGNTTYSVTVTDASADSAAVNITVGETPVGTKPVSDFIASDTTINEGAAISYLDQSQNSPISWSWLFNGGTPLFSTDQNPIGITYDVSGCYDTKLITTNPAGSDTLIKSCYIDVGTVGIDETVYLENIKIYPNPSRGVFTVEYEMENVTGETVDVKVFDVLGRMVYGTTMTNSIITIDIHRQAGRVFMLQLQNNHAVNYKKVVME